MTTRRRCLTILAGAAALPFVGVPPLQSAGLAKTKEWRGLALGARARILLDHPRAETLIPQAVAEIGRLEAIFSLYRADSQLSRLNREGLLRGPAFELVELLSICDRVFTRTDGAFDPTVQALWALYARQYSKGGPPSPEQISQARTITGWAQVEYGSEKISIRRTGVQLTLNGIAQGYIADRIAAFFRRNGVTDVLINTGEIVGLGNAPGGAPWQVKLDDDKNTGLPLRNAAIATSAPLGTVFDDGGEAGHIIDPRTGKPGGTWSKVTVVSRLAAEADGLSTGFCLMSRPQIMAAKKEARVFLRA
ncbi:Nitrous oxide reductase maturation periplasmic protein NosX [hydrothermal vent metagenome]|uniref:FAD:protein FMN transferase n=1 Tax=hydrothermal vent metagenome TaxID=652676 RepID=A0A3B0U693_9ZZZZ